MNATEIEVLVLNIALGIIEEILNTDILCFHEGQDSEISEVTPQSLLSKKYFSIILLELISETDPSVAETQKKSIIECLRAVGESPLIGKKEYASGILKTSSDFADWLSKSFDHDIYSAIGKNIKVSFTRKEMIYFCGNKNKHFLMRSGVLIKKINKIYKNGGIQLSSNEMLKVLEDIDSWLFEDVFAYHLTKVCELINNVYNSILDYLEPIFMERFNWVNKPIYQYKVPIELTTDFSISQFYELLNRIWHKDHTRKKVISTSEFLTLRF